MTTDCFTFQAPENSLRGATRAQGVRPAGAPYAVPAIGVSPDRWLSWLQPQRMAYLRTMYPRAISESQASYDNRLRAAGVSITTSAIKSTIRPAGDPGFRHRHAPAGATAIEYGPSFGRRHSVLTSIVRPAGGANGQRRESAFRLISNAQGNPPGTDPGSSDSGDAMGKDSSYGGGSSGSDGGLSQASQTAIINTAGQALGMTAATIQAAITQGNQTERARIDADARVAIATLQQQMQGSTDPAANAAAQQQITALQAIQAQLAAPSSSNTMILVAAVVAVAAIGAVVLMRPRHNPVIYKPRGKSRFRTKERLVPKMFVAARHLR